MCPSLIILTSYYIINVPKFITYHAPGPERYATGTARTTLVFIIVSFVGFSDVLRQGVRQVETVETAQSRRRSVVWIMGSDTVNCYIL